MSEIDIENGREQVHPVNGLSSEKQGVGISSNDADTSKLGTVQYLDVGDEKIHDLRMKYPILGKLKLWEMALDKKLGMEGQGIERIPEDKRHPPSNLNMIFFWFSNLFSLGLIPIGMLGPIFGISLRDSIILSVFASILGSILPAFTATLTPALGLRQIAASRYAFGIWGAKLCGLLNICVNVGFGTVNCIIGGSLLAAVADQSLPLAVGIIIIAVLSFIVSLFGFRVIHTYERYAWIAIFILLCVQYGEAAQYFSNTPAAFSGLDYTGSCLSYFAILLGEATGWASLSGDYYCHYPPTISKQRVFWYTLFGLSVPTIFTAVLGNLYGTTLVIDDLAAVYDASGIGGLIVATMHPVGFAKFAAVMFVLSFIGNLIAIIYSSALSIQLWGSFFYAVPRFIWCFVLFAIILALALGGRLILETILSNFASILGYWTIAFGFILMIEHFWFRRNVGYDPTAWQDQSRLPLGIAGTLALCIGFGGAVLGMVQTWFVGPVAALIGSDGGDVGDYFSMVLSSISYFILLTSRSNILVVKI